jgi:hypothetical protein
MKTEEIIMDRAFDAACLILKGETDWANQIMERLKSNYPQNTEYIDGVYKLYIDAGTNNPDFVSSRGEYMINNKNKIKLRFK